MTVPIDKVFQHSLRVPYGHVDAMGVVYYANYLLYFEMARNEMLREAGVTYRELEKQGLNLPVIEAHCFYKQPARYDDWLTIYTYCALVQGVRLRIDYEIRRDNDLLVTGHTIHVCLSSGGKILRPPPALQALVAETKAT